MFLCNTGKPHRSKASWARPMYNSIGITMQRQEVCSAISIASPHKSLLVVKRVLKRLEDTAWLSLIKWLCGSTTSRQHSSETRLIHDHGRVALSVLVFHKRALWHSPRRSGAFCRRGVKAPKHPAFHNSVTPPSLPLLQPEISHIPCYVSFS